MPKVITSPVEQFPGPVTIADPMRIDQAQAVETAIRGIRALRDPEQPDKEIAQSDMDALAIPAIEASIEKWNLKGVTNFVPASPRVPSAELVSWLLIEVLKVYNGTGDVDDPNA